MYQFQDDEVNCFCFGGDPALERTQRGGLRSISDYRGRGPENMKARTAYSTDMKKSDHSKGEKTSLRRNKPRTPVQSRIHSPLVESKPEPPLPNQSMSFQLQPRQQRRNGNLYFREPAYHPQITPKETYKITFGSTQPEPSVKPISQIRNYYNRYNVQPLPSEIIELNIPEYNAPKAVPVSSRMSLPANHKISLHRIEQMSQQYEKSDGKIQISGLSTPRVEPEPQQHSSSRKNSSRISLTPRDHPTRLHLKQIESVLDQNQRLEDNISEVIGRGWDDNREYQDFDMRHQDRIKTETIVTTASHVKNSSTGNSQFAVSESLMRWA